MNSKFANSPRNARNVSAIYNEWKLSGMEQRVLSLLVEGFSNIEVATHLCLSIKTVSTYLTRAKEKMGFVTMTRACVLWDRHIRSQYEQLSASQAPAPATQDMEEQRQV